MRARARTCTHTLAEKADKFVNEFRAEMLWGIVDKTRRERLLGGPAGDFVDLQVCTSCMDDHRSIRIICICPDVFHPPTLPPPLTRSRSCAHKSTYMQ